MFVISLDADWVPHELLVDSAKILKQFDIRATFFLTNSVDTTFLNHHELAIHPHFTSDKNYDEILSTTIEFLPNKKTKGSRSHKLYHSMELMAHYKKFGIEYDSNYYLPHSPKPLPVHFAQSDVVEIPFFFGDDTFFTLKHDFDINSINLDDEGVKVFLFHPFHIFNNVSSVQEYQNLKSHYKDFDYLSEHRTLEKKGIRTVFYDLLEYIKKMNIETHTLEEINSIWRKKFEEDKIH